MSQIQEIRLRNFRCFCTNQSVRLAPLTFLIGENSTGKTSFLAAVKAISDVGNSLGVPAPIGNIDFNAPYDLGMFSNIVHRSNQEKNKVDSFELGISRLVNSNSVVSAHQDKPSNLVIKLDVTIESDSAGAPYISKYLIGNDDVWIKLNEEGYGEDYKTMSTEIGSNSKSWELNRYMHFSGYSDWFLLMINEIPTDNYEQFCDFMAGFLEDNQSVPSPKEYKKLLLLFDYYFFLRSGSSAFAGSGSSAFASAPIRSRPRRTYEPIKITLNPEGSHVPTLLAYLHSQEQKKWDEVKNCLENFGKNSGLFKEISVNSFGNLGSPFQLQITNNVGGKRNLIDVGYGVSQILPILVEFYRSDAHQSLFLIQQPEVHLHPSAQADLGNLFCNVASSERQLVVETHSDFVLDRVRILVRNQKFKPEDVSFVYFEQKEEEVKIHNITLDKYGNLENPPPGYRSFFLKETNRVLGFED